MDLSNLSIGQLVLLFGSSFISLIILFTSFINSLWVDTVAAGLTVSFHILIIAKALLISRCRGGEESSSSSESKCKPASNASWAIACTSLLAAIWVICFALTTDIAISGPAMDMGKKSALSSVSKTMVKRVTIAQAVLAAFESAALVVMIVLSLHEEAMKKLAKEEEDPYKCDSPTEMYS
jgi:hypothetical protein